MNKTKMFAIGAVTLMAMGVLVQAWEIIPSYSVSEMNSSPFEFLACGDDNATGGGGNETGGSGNETGENGNWTVQGNNETGGNVNWTGGNETVGSNVSGSLEPGEIYGTVFFISNNSQIPVENANVAVLYNENFSDVLIETLTDENGYYTFDSLMPGLYQIRASKQDYSATINAVDLHSNESIELNLVLEKESNYGYPLENITILKAIEDGRVGGKINVWQKDNVTYDHEILIYDGVNITELDVTKGAVSFTVSGNESSTGKTIIINVNSSVLNSDKDIAVEYDGKTIKMADDINDVLNPNDDGSNPEYLISKGANGTQILVSIPHFSEHEIMIYSLAENVVEALGGITAVIIYIAICMVAAAVFVSSIYVRRKI